MAELATPRTGMQRVAHLAGRAWRAEVAGWRSLGRFITRRPTVPRGASAFSYDRPIRPILIALLGVSAIEVPVVDLIVHPWPFVRWPLLALGIWGITYMGGMLLGFLTRPHAVGPEGIRVRHGGEVDIDLPWDDVASVARKRSAAPDAKTFTVEDDPRGRRLSILVQDATDVEIELERPLRVRIPSGDVEVSVIRISVDDVAGFMAAARMHLQPS